MKLDHFVKLAFVIVTMAAQNAVADTIWAPAGGNNLWSNATNWNPGTVPNGAVNVQISNPPSTQPFLDINASVNNLTLTGASSSLNVSNQVALTINGGPGAGMISNAGTLTLQGDSTHVALLLFDGASSSTITNSGSGQLVLNVAAIGAPQVGMTFQNNGNLSGGGDLGVFNFNDFRFNNTGIVNANINTTPLAIDPSGSGITGTFNTGTIEATNGATLSLGGKFDNTGGGVISTDGVGSQARIAGGIGATIINGTLQSTNGSLGFISSGEQFALAGTIGLNGKMLIDGTVFNSNINLSNAAGNTVTLNGGAAGVVTLNSATNTAAFINAPQAGVTFVNNATLQGAGILGGAASFDYNFTNSGTVNANLTGQSLQVAPSLSQGITNTGTLQASNGGQMQILSTGLVLNNTGGTITADGTNSSVTLSNVIVNGGTLASSGTSQINVTGNFSGIQGAVELDGTLVVNGPSTNTFSMQAGSSLNINGNKGGQMLIEAGPSDSTLLLHNTAPGGTATLNGSGFSGLALVPGAGGGTVHVTANQAGMTLVNNTIISGSGAFDASGGHLFAVTNNGTIRSGVTLTIDATSITNNGTIMAGNFSTLGINTNVLTNYNAATHTLTGGTLWALQGTIIGSPGFDIVNNQATIQLSGIPAGITDGTLSALRDLATNGAQGSFTLELTSDFALTGGFTSMGMVDDDQTNFTVLGGYDQEGGQTEDDGTINAAFMLKAGLLTGVGGINGTVTNTGGTLFPGIFGLDEPGAFHITGDYSQGSGGTFEVQIDDLIAFDSLQISGSGSLDGVLEVTLMGYTGHLGDVFTILKSNGLTGNFATLELPTLSGGLYFVESTDGKNVFLTVAAPEPSTIFLFGCGLALIVAQRFQRKRRGN